MQFADRSFSEQVVMDPKDPSDTRRYLDKEIYPSNGRVSASNAASWDPKADV